MLIDTIRSLFSAKPDTPQDAASAADATPRHAAQSSDAVEPVALAACVLLLDLAHADGEFSESEQAHLEQTLQRHYALDAEQMRSLLAEAERERRSAVDHFRFTSQLKNQYDLGQKMVLAEVMWGMVLADGEVSDHEHYLTRKISNLLDLEPGYLSAAKAAAASRQG